jgi:hypothetical protein
MYINDTPQALFADDTCRQGGLCPKKTSAWAQLNGGVVQTLGH